jgi:RimJ/RimL family protein N-acetyltransferase
VRPEKIPYVIETPRLRVRCWCPDDAESQFSAIDRSRAHLQPWMPWHSAHVTVDDTRAWSRTARGKFDLMQDFVMGIFRRDTGACIGGTGIHVRSLEASTIEIGYWLAVDATGHGFAREVVAALVDVALGPVECRRIEIRIEPENHKSRAIPIALGFEQEGIARAAIPRVDGNHDVVIYARTQGRRP